MSNVPPPFPNAEGYRRKSNTGLIVMIIVAVLVGGCILLVGAVAFFSMTALNNVKPLLGCAVSFEAVHGSLRDYAKDHGGKLPSASTWQDELRPYMKRTMAAAKKDMEGAEAFMRVMDLDGNWGCYTGQGDKMTGMAFNESVSGKKVDDLESPMTTVIVFEVEDNGKNLAMPYKRQEESKSPAIFGDNRGWFEVTWDGSEILEDGKRVRMNTSSRPVEASPVEGEKQSDSEGQ